MAEVKTTPIADPGPLGLCGFALTTFVLSWANAGLFPSVKGDAADVMIVVGIAVFYGGIAQLLAGMWEFRNGNTFGATAFSSYGAFWLSFAAIFIPGFGIGGAFGASGPTAAALGVYLLGWTIFTAIMTLGALRINGALSVVFVLLLVTFLLLTIGAFAGSAGITHIGGYLGLLTALAAWYTAMAGILRSVTGGTIALPVFPVAVGAR